MQMQIPCGNDNKKSKSKSLNAMDAKFKCNVRNVK
jgi:hypothetical protein